MASVLVTTEKDLARMQGDDDAVALAARSRALPVTLAFDDEAGFRSLLREHDRPRPRALNASALRLVGVVALQHDLGRE